MRTGLFRFLKLHRWDALIALLILLEVAFMLYFNKGRLPNGVNELCFTLSSILIGVLLLIKYYGREVQYVPAATIQEKSRLRMIVYPLLICGMAAFAFAAVDVFKETPVNPSFSDVIPTIQVAVERMLSGERVYATINKFGYQLPLTYLPMQWMPYTIAALLQVDYRWVAVGIFFLAAIVMVVRCNRVSPVYGIAAALLTVYTGGMLLMRDTGILSMTVELMVAGYYMLFMAGISGRNPWLRGAAIAVCLLSRYSLVLWLPLWAFVEFAAAGRKDFFRSCGVIVLLVLGLYVIPFLSHDWGAFARSYHYYSQAAKGEWNNVDGDNSIPAQLNNGLGFARLFYEKLWHYSVADRLKSLQKVHFAVCIGSAVIMGAWYWIKRRRIHPRIFLMASFKIYLSLFLAFIQVPYPYLMITAAAVSIAIFAELPRWRVGNRLIG
jgi:hypothetical protein